MKSKGTVYLVGAGPGDSGLLTMRGAELLARADVVVYDALINQDLLRLAPKGAEIIYAGKRSKDHAIPQDELNDLLVAKAREGKTVVRLKGGDPYIFGRGGEEAAKLAAAKIPFEVVPGVSSVVAGPNYAGIPLTHRDYSSSFTVITGHEDPEKQGAGVDWAQIAKISGTKVILMGVERIRELSDNLVKNGMPAETPVAMVHWGTTGRQQSIEGTLATIADVVEKTSFTAPAVTVIGDVVKLRKSLNWYESRPLFGQRVVVTRTREQASQLSRQLAELSAEVLEIPTIKIVPTDRKADLADALLELNSYDWIVFTSPNGVTMFFESFFKAFEDLRDIGGVRIAAVGPATAAKLRELHLKVDLMPEEYVAVKIAAAFAKFETIENLKLLLLRAEVATPELPAALEALGGIVDDVACYKTVPETEDLNGAAARLLEDGADWITFTSSSTVENFHARFDLPALLKKFPQIKLASIGPETTRAVETLGLKPDAEAKPHTIEGLVRALTSGT
ncbi:MAG TPA: uroporphyrinogen-III C-methyltransferase [Verrucomicrobiae bacterium]|jgi:uroporphyrinogen III methyltransferase/synthase|nr:uroporphyrinogen-III C-methyltransferase [Verrucomicrobiae bacterium]